MSDQDSTIFTDDKKTVVTPDDQTGVQDESANKAPKIDLDAMFKDHLSSITDDNGQPKYRDVFTALEALKHTQAHVKTLQEENKTFRESQTQATTMEEALRRLSANKEQNDSTKSPELDAEKLKGMTLETLRQYEAEKSARANEQAVSDALVKKFGDAEKAKAAYATKADELGIDADTLRSLAQRSPKAVLSYFDVKEQRAFDKNLEGSVNTDAFNKTQRTTEAPRNIMYGASSQDVLSAWKAAGQSVLNEFER